MRAVPLVPPRALQLFQPRRVQCHRHRAVLLEAGGLAGLSLQTVVEADRIAEQLGDVGAGPQLADEAGGDGAAEHGGRKNHNPDYHQPRRNLTSKI